MPPVVRDGVFVLLWMVGIFLVSNIPNLHSGFKEDYLYRKCAHVLEYSVLSFLLWRFLRHAKTPRGATMGAVLFLGVFYALSDEVHQLHVLGREGKLSDVGIDSLGLLLALPFFRR